MLAKVAPSSNDFHALARYLLRGKPGSTPDPKRVAWTFSQNLPTDDPELAATYMNATAQLSRRTKNAAYHMMIAWHERERPSPDLMQKVARETLDLAGLAEHQALVMGHGDKPHAHLHILLNRVHPDSGRAWKTTHDFACLDRIMQHLADAHGCEYVPAHAFNPDLTDDIPKQPDSGATYAAKRGANTARPQWSRKVSRKLGSDISDELTLESTPDDIEDLLEGRGLTLEPKGSGFVVGNTEGYAKLSSLRLQGSAHDALTLHRTSHRRPPTSHPRRFVFHVDAIDVAKAFHTIGLISKDDLRTAIADTVAERQSRIAAKSIAQKLEADLRQTLKLTTSLTPTRNQLRDQRVTCRKEPPPTIARADR